MLWTLGNTQRERESKFTVKDFIDANIDLLTQWYLDEFPQAAHDINDGNLDDVYVWATNETNLGIRDKMETIYSLHIEG